MPKLKPKTNNQIDKMAIELSTSISKNVFPQDYFKQLSDSLMWVQKLNKSFTNTFAELNLMKNSLAEISNTLSFPLHNIAEEITRGLSNFTGFIGDFVKFREKEKDAFIKAGWIVCPSLDHMSMPVFARAINKYHQGDKGRQIAFLMKKYYGADNDWKLLAKTVESWKQHKLFTEQRMKIILDAFDAHKNKKYTLSIPALLPQIEGIITDFGKKTKGKIPDGKTTKKAKHAMKLLKLQGENYEAEITLSFIEQQLYISTKELKIKTHNRKTLNRHGILHGIFPGYPDCTRSLKCFMLLDVLTLLKV